MKATELIAQLQELVEKHGDVDVAGWHHEFHERASVEPQYVKRWDQIVLLPWGMNQSDYLTFNCIE